MIVVYHPEKPLEGSLVLGHRIILENCDSVRKREDTGGSDFMAEEIDLGDTEDALVFADHQAIGLQQLKDLSKVVLVHHCVHARHQVVVQVHKCER